MAHGPALGGIEARVLPASWRALKDRGVSVGPLHILVSNVPDEYRDFVAKCGGETFNVDFRGKDDGNKHRHLFLHQKLTEYADSTAVILVDARDTYLQPAVARWTNRAKWHHGMYVSYEYAKHSECPWNTKDAARLQSNLRARCRKDVSNWGVVNGSFVYGAAEDLAWFEFARYCVDLREGTGSDQASLNVIVRECLSVTVVPWDNWVFHGHWYKQATEAKALQVKDGLLCNVNGEPFAIHHQFDRTPLAADIYKRLGLKA